MTGTSHSLLAAALCSGLCAATTTFAADDYPRQALFGDTHVHTGWSADAGMDGAVVDPFQAYQFGRGEEITSNTGMKAKLHRPFDWFMVTDHSDGMGVINEIVAGNPEMMASPVLKRWRDALQEGGAAAASAKSELVRMQSNGELPSQVTDPKWMVSAWEQTIKAAEQYYKPGEFTTFIAYEWTVNADGGDNLHRNVIFRDGADRAAQVRPLTTFETQEPKKLWAWMKAYEDKTGGRVLAIPHNGNMSNGRMFEEQQFDGTPMTREWAETRAHYEPLYELTQIKGQSESHPLLSPGDEFASWDLWDRGNLILVPKPEGSFPKEYWREALKAGMRIEGELGANPFRYGANAGTDTHTGLSTSEEDNFFGKFKTLEPRKERWNFPLLEGESDNYMGWEMAGSGAMGVWATENTREAIWDAMKRRETFATTGPRMTLRFFGGYDFRQSDLGVDLAEAGYQRGVPMGADLKADSDGRVPTFIVAAQRDPQGANLDRLQVIKGWVDVDGEVQERIYDVAWSDGRKPGADGKLPAVGSTVDTAKATYSNRIGDDAFAAVWTDPDFDASQRAFYYLRVLEIPTPRWTLYDKVRYGADMPDSVPLVHQERAFSSPIWYVPKG
ncbi:DUF3604 domain-containing protein [Parahaliea aestuarii]|uniref:DUF3604 domain-containing protein n=1 Tax=Parahaliea aestuarii TaxID=1852021 RepID=A0A5C9A418_9GAMM|nr:DUF3604 domain-containing protein [Parahaliea aestuarii]TXS94377.1 DUF3604 domain-containing protein [Parahaliea aestuarii]